MLTTREQHPTGITAAIATLLAPLIVLIANAAGAGMSEAESIAITSAIIGLATVIASWRSPRVTLPAAPEVPVTRGIEPTPATVTDVAPETPTEKVQASKPRSRTSRTKGAKSGKPPAAGK